MPSLRIHYTKAISPWTDKNRGVRVSYKCTAITTDILTEDTPGMPSAIFVYAPLGEDYLFSHVASATDLVDYPEEPGDAFMRKDAMDILVPCMQIASECCQKIEEDIRFLARNIAEYTRIVGREEHVAEATL